MSDDTSVDTTTTMGDGQVSQDGQTTGLPPSSEQETIIQRLKDIPLDKLKEIITNQIDLEIRLKHKELKLTEQEVGKIESQMLILRKFFEIPNDVKIDNEPNEFTLKYFDLLNKSLTLTYNDVIKQQTQTPVQSNRVGLFNPDFLDLESAATTYNDYNPYGVGHSYRTRSTTSSLRPSHYSVPVVQSDPQVQGVASPGSSVAASSHSAPTSASVPATVPNQNFIPARIMSQHLGCLYRRTDGVIVKLTCPDCQRSNFSSAQGFLNHSRIAHSKEYTSQDAAALKCGSIIPEIKQEPNGERSIQRLIERGVDPNRNLNVNEVYFTGYEDYGDVQSNNSSARNSTTGPNTRNSSVESNAIKSDNSSTNLNDINFKPSEGELLKKIIKDGKMNKEDYEKLVDDTKKPLNNTHLFDDEFEEEDNAESESINSSTTIVGTISSIGGERKMKRRKSRGGINITVTRGDSGLEVEGDDEDEEDDDEDVNVVGVDVDVRVETTSKESCSDTEPEAKRKKKS